MSQILDRLKQAEEERQRVIAERRRLESEADAALAARERDELARGVQRVAPPAPPQRPETPQQRSRVAAAVAMAMALAVVFWVGTLMPGKPAAPPPAAAPAPAAPPAPVVRPARTPPELFKLERNLDAFAARVPKDGP